MEHVTHVGKVGLDGVYPVLGRAFHWGQFHEAGEPSEEGCEGGRHLPLLGPRRAFIFNLEGFGITLRG